MEKFFMRFFLKTIGTPNFVRRIEWKKLIKWVNPEKKEKILDLACGFGLLSIIMAKKGCSVYGVDVNQNVIERAKELASSENVFCEFIVGDAENLTFPNEFFDKIVSSSSLEHFNNDVKALEECYRVLKPGGSIVITVDSLSYPINDKLKKKHKKLHHVVNYYDKNHLKELFKNVNLDIKNSEYILNSKITSIFFNYLFIKRTKSNKFTILLNLFCYPLCLISDKFFGGEKGYTLIVEGTKKF